MPTSSHVKKETQRRFDRTAEAYVNSAVHATGDDLEMLLEMASPQLYWTTLDIATGGGHTARTLAPHVQHVIAADIAPQMLTQAWQAMPYTNVSYIQADADYLPFPDAYVDLITCRIAAHHFPDPFQFIQEAARVLKPGGLFLVEDHVNVEDERAARYIDAFERLRDPSHIHALAEYEWRGLYLDARLEITDVRHISKPAGGLPDWAERQNCDQETIEKLTVMLAKAPSAVSTYYSPCHLGTDEADFTHHYILLAGRKPD